MNDNHKSIHQTLDQVRAMIAWEYVSQAKKELKDFEKYVSLVKKFPAIINNNGLGQALAFIFSKANFNSKNAETFLFIQLQEWLTRSEKNKDIMHYSPPYPEQKDKNKSINDHLIKCIISNNSMLYLRATHETMALLDKLRNFASGLAIDKGERHG